MMLANYYSKIISGMAVFITKLIKNNEKIWLGVGQKSQTFINDMMQRCEAR